MVTLRIEPYLFATLQTGFEAAARDDAPIDPELLDRVRAALIEASATALPGLLILVALKSEDELYALATCFEVGCELDPCVTENQWDSIQDVMDQALLAGSVANFSTGVRVQFASEGVYPARE